MLAGTDELLSEQRPHPRRPLDSPDTRLKPCRPLNESVSLMTISLDTNRVND